ncbi:MAG: hypothetical protein OEY44_00725 [Candidatus Peregrinibacteria bacterium]|nr:hypothetical protein [Candidatus Peregrinibacteria bacterium]
MKKLQLFIVVLLVIALMVFADYYVNKPEGIEVPKIPVQEKIDEKEKEPETVSLPDLTRLALELGAYSDKYEVEKRTRSTELFEIFNVGSVANITVFKNTLTPSVEEGGLGSLLVYEVQGPQAQGRVTFLNLKLKMIEHLGNAEGINETGSYGYNSLFYNDPSSEASAHLLTQVGDTVFGFKYSRAEEGTFEFIKTFIEVYQEAIKNNS